MKQHFNFEGTATRSEYCAMIVIGSLGYIIGASTLETAPVFSLAVMVAVAWYALATTARRIRDTGNSLWWMLALLVPVIGTIVTVVFGFLPTQEQE
jgi:uncharacterized membrane protein YhaH (DUF805 family)